MFKIGLVKNKFEEVDGESNLVSKGGRNIPGKIQV